MTNRDLKRVAASLTVVGAVLSILDKIFAPHHLLLESSPNYPDALRTAGWLFLLIPPLLYIILDFPNLFSFSKSQNNIEHKEKKDSADSETINK